MCFASGPDSTLVIKSDDPEAAQKYGFDSPPTAPPDYTGKSIADVEAAQGLMVKAGRGRASTFLTGPTGVTGAPKLGRTLLGG